MRSVAHGGLATALLVVAATATAAPAPAPAPHYVTIVRQIDVAKPAAVVWARVGKFCDLTQWLGKSCAIVSGKPGEIGAARLVDHSIIEILVGKTATSYTYAQPEKAGAQVHFYHGTLDVEPLSPTASRIVYSLYYDNSAIVAPAARDAEYQQRAALFGGAVKAMKRIAEAP